MVMNHFTYEFIITNFNLHIKKLRLSFRRVAYFLNLTVVFFFNSLNLMKCFLINDLHSLFTDIIKNFIDSKPFHPWIFISFDDKLFRIISNQKICQIEMQMIWNIYSFFDMVMYEDGVYPKDLTIVGINVFNTCFFLCFIYCDC